LGAEAQAVFLAQRVHGDLQLELFPGQGRLIQISFGQVDDIEILSLADPKPLVGEGHEHFAFNNWQVELCFDNLRITPLPS
jgi:hypothetical protein